MEENNNSWKSEFTYNLQSLLQKPGALEEPAGTLHREGGRASSNRQQEHRCLFSPPGVTERHGRAGAHSADVCGECYQPKPSRRLALPPTPAPCPVPSQGGRRTRTLVGDRRLPHAQLAPSSLLSTRGAWPFNDRIRLKNSKITPPENTTSLGDTRPASAQALCSSLVSQGRSSRGVKGYLDFTSSYKRAATLIIRANTTHARSHAAQAPRATGAAASALGL